MEAVCAKQAYRCAGGGAAAGHARLQEACGRARGAGLSLKKAPVPAGLRQSGTRRAPTYWRAASVVTCGSSTSPPAFTERQEALVKESWAELKKDAARHSFALFKRVFEIAPSAKLLFPFLKESTIPLEKNSQLKSHSLKVFVVICEAATSLRKKGHVATPGTTMKDMAMSHAVSGVVNEHYEVVKYSLLKTLEEGLPADKWNDEVKEAWSIAYDELVDAIKHEPST